MCSYNQVNNSQACQNSYILNYLLKGELGFQGFVVSDWVSIILLLLQIPVFHVLERSRTHNFRTHSRTNIICSKGPIRVFLLYLRVST
jgi:hypothetical protein